MVDDKGLLNQSVFFKGEVAYHEIAEQIKRSHSLIIFSDTESQSCVVLESLSIGRPAIVTNIGGVKELIREDNGLRVEVRDEDDLVEKMKYMIAHYTHFDQQLISQKAIAQFSYEEVGKQFAEIYKNI